MRFGSRFAVRFANLPAIVMRILKWMVLQLVNGKSNEKMIVAPPLYEKAMHGERFGETHQGKDMERIGVVASPKVLRLVEPWGIDVYFFVKIAGIPGHQDFP